MYSWWYLWYSSVTGCIYQVFGGPPEQFVAVSLGPGHQNQPQLLWLDVRLTAAFGVGGCQCLHGTLSLHQHQPQALSSRTECLQRIPHRKDGPLTL